MRHLNQFPQHQEEFLHDKTQSSEGAYTWGVEASLDFENGTIPAYQVGGPRSRRKLIDED